MEARINLAKMTRWLGKYKYAALILLLGVALMLWPTGESETQPAREQESVDDQEDPALEERLEGLLSQVEGAGQVKVILTYKTGTQYVYQTDEEKEEQQGTDVRSSRKTETVLVTVDGVEQAVITQTVYPTFLGAVVLCQGADDPGVRLDLVNAVSSLTGLTADKISVIKMEERR